MKKLLYLFLLPSILFSQTTPSVTPRVDGEGSLGTETYRWGEGHFEEIYVEAPALSDDSNRVPTTSWVSNLVQSGGTTINYIYKNSSFTAEPNKKYTVNTVSGDVTVTLPELSEELVGSSIVIRHANGNNNILINRAGANNLEEVVPGLPSFTFKGVGSQVELAAFSPSTWLITRSGRTIEPSVDSDTNIAATTSWVNNLVDITKLNYLENSGNHSYEGNLNLEQGDLTITSYLDLGLEANIELDRPDYGNIHTDWDDLSSDGIINVVAEDYSPANSETLLSFKDIFTSTPYTEFVQPVKAPTPMVSDDSTNVATTAWVQDEIATKADLTDPVFTDSLTIESEANSEPLQFDFQGGLADSKFGFKWNDDGNIMRLGVTNETTVTYNSLLEFQTMDVPAATSIVSNVPLFVPDQGVVEYDDDRVATTEWVNWAISESGGGTTEDPVFTGVVTAPTVFTDLGSNCFKIINPAGGAVSGSTSLVPGAEVVIQLPEVPTSTNYRCFIKISIDGRSTIIVEGSTGSNALHGIYVSGILCQDLTNKILKVRTGYVPATTGYYRPHIVLGDKDNSSLYNIWGSTTTIVVEEVVFCTTDDIIEDLKEPLVVEIRNSVTPDSGIYYTKYLYPPATAISNNKLTGGIIEEETPASSSATGTKGMIRYDANYVYVCVATDTWIRLEKATW